METASFRALVVSHTPNGFSIDMRRLEPQKLFPAEVLIRVVYSAVNYKDALVCTPHSRIAQISPLIPGLELTGVVVESSDSRFQAGDRVLANDFGHTLGVARHGGYSEYAYVPGDFLLSLPTWMSFKQALVFSIGMAAAMGLGQLEKNGLTPQQGPVLAALKRFRWMRTVLGWQESVTAISCGVLPAQLSTTICVFGRELWAHPQNK